MGGGRFWKITLLFMVRQEFAGQTHIRGRLREIPISPIYKGAISENHPTIYRVWGSSLNCSRVI